MQVSECSLGRVFVMRIDDGEDILSAVKGLVREKGIASAMIHILGAVGEGLIVTGPETPVIPPVPHFETAKGGWEVLGLGTVYPSEDGPRIHMHVSVGRGRETLTGCLREIATTYLVVEVVILELVGLSARRVFDSEFKLHMLRLEEGS